MDGTCYVIANGECISPFPCPHGDPIPLDEFVTIVKGLDLPRFDKNRFDDDEMTFMLACAALEIGEFLDGENAAQQMARYKGMIDAFREMAKTKEDLNRFYAKTLEFANGALGQDVSRRPHEGPQDEARRGGAIPSGQEPDQQRDVPSAEAGSSEGQAPR